jgi:hypothetical protein
LLGLQASAILRLLQLVKEEAPEKVYCSVVTAVVIQESKPPPVNFDAPLNVFDRA